MLFSWTSLRTVLSSVCRAGGVFLLPSMPSLFCVRCFVTHLFFLQSHPEKCQRPHLRIILKALPLVLECSFSLGIPGPNSSTVWTRTINLSFNCILFFFLHYTYFTTSLTILLHDYFLRLSKALTGAH
jgi:hypothetical protein